MTDQSTYPKGTTMKRTRKLITPIYSQTLNDAMDRAVEIDDMEALEGLEAMNRHTAPKSIFDAAGKRLA